MRVKCVTNFEKQAELVLGKKCKKKPPPCRFAHVFGHGKTFSGSRFKLRDSFRRSIFHDFAAKSIRVKLSRLHTF